MNSHEQIRALIPEKESAKGPGEIVKRMAELMPEVKPQRIREAIGEMFRAEILNRVGNRSDGFRYYVTRAVKLKSYATPEERAAAKRATDAASHRRRYALLKQAMANNPEKKQAALAKRRQAKAAAREAQRMHRERLEQERRERLTQQREAEKQATRAAVQAKRAQRKATRVLSPEQRILAHAPAKSVPKKTPLLEAPPAAPGRESVEEWMARTGKKPEVLPIGKCATPLRYIGGHRAIDQRNWRHAQERDRA